VSETITQAEYAAAVRRAHTECEQEIHAAALEYKEAMRPIATQRKQRGRDARSRRDERIATLRVKLARSRCSVEQSEQQQ
jgi:hypothetical protein